MSSDPSDGTATPVTSMTKSLAGVDLGTQSWGDFATSTPAPAPAAAAAPAAAPGAGAGAATAAPDGGAGAGAGASGTGGAAAGGVDDPDNSARARDELKADVFDAPTTVGKNQYLATIGWEDPTIQLSPEVIKGAIEVGWEKPTRVQAVGLTLLAQGRALPAGPKPVGAHVLVKAATGCGKTGCFGLAAVSNVTPGERGPQVVVILPSRPLAVEVHGIIRELGKHIPWNGAKGLPIGLAIGGMARTRITEPVLVCCIGSLIHWSKKSSGLIDLSNVKLMAVDEADEFTTGKGVELSNVKRLMRKDVQVALFSATFGCLKQKRSQPYKAVVKLVGNEADGPTRGSYVRAEVQTDVTHPNTIVFNRVFPDTEAKFAWLKMFAWAFGDRILIFCNEGRTVDRLARMLNEDWTSPTGPEKGISVGIMKGGMKKDHIDTFFQQFNDGAVKVLVSTRRAGARGLNYPNLRLVVEFDIPRDDFGVAHDSFHHQLGRVGRMGTPGVGLNLIAGDKEVTGAAELAAEMKRPFVALDATKPVKDAVEHANSFIRGGWEGYAKEMRPAA